MDVPKDSFNIFTIISALTKTNATHLHVGTTLASTRLVAINVAAQMVTSSIVICKYVFR